MPRAAPSRPYSPPLTSNTSSANTTSSENSGLPNNPRHTTTWTHTQMPGRART